MSSEAEIKYEALLNLQSAGFEVDDLELAHWRAQAADEIEKRLAARSLTEPAAETPVEVIGKEPSPKVSGGSYFDFLKTDSGSSRTFSYPEKCRHEPTELRLNTASGEVSIWLASEGKISTDDIVKFDLFVTLNGNLPRTCFGDGLLVYDCTLPDFGMLEDINLWCKFMNFFLEEARKGKKILAYCTGGHGRTGTFGASMIATAEGAGNPDLDPVKEIRTRYCTEAVESYKQISAVFKILGKPVPEKYEEPVFTVRSYVVKWLDPMNDKDARHAPDCECMVCSRKKGSSAGFAL